MVRQAVGHVVTATTIGHLRWSPSTHLGVLLADVERLAAKVATAVDDGHTAPQLWHLAVIATCRLDGSGMTTMPSAGDVTSLVTDDSAVEEVMRREYAGASNALGADDLAGLLRADPLKALPALHRTLTSGLVAPPVTGQLRRTEQAVHDGGEGRVVFQPVPPAAIATALGFLSDLMAGHDLHPVVTAGLLQFELLRLHPFESANGRLARVAARLVLRDAGLDPAGLAVAEVAMSQRPVGNYDAAAGALRSNDLTVWLETWGEDVATGLRLATSALGLAATPPAVSAPVLDDLPTKFTVAQLRDRMPGDAPGDIDETRRVVSGLADAGLATVETGTRGLRLRRGGPSLPRWHDWDMRGTPSGHARRQGAAIDQWGPHDHP